MPWDPLRELQAWQERLASHHQLDAWTPPTDVYETTELYVITAELPGVARGDIELSIENGRLTIHGRRSDPSIPGGPARYHQVERGRGPFSRTFEFVDRVDASRVSAELANGVLTVTLRKLPEPPVRRIEVG